MLKIMVGFLLFTASPYLFSEPSVMTQDERADAFLNLDWKEPGTYKLPDSHSTLILPSGHIAVIGKDADRAQVLDGNPSRATSEALTLQDDFKNPVLFDNIKEGYIKLDDWENLDSKALLGIIIENTENANEERVRQGFSKLHVGGWIQEPTLDKKTNTVYWALEAKDDEESLVNSVALKLGREGYERYVWVTDKETYTPRGGELDIMLRAHSFDPGFRYEDYTSGDKVAAYGIAALVAATVGGKLIKGGILALLLKKIGAVIIAAIAAAAYKFRAIFKRKKDKVEIDPVN